VRTPVFGEGVERLARLCASMLLFCFLEGGVESFEVGRRLRVRRVAGMVSFIFNGAEVAECVWTEVEGSASCEI
jgi:hypothetical protein